MRIPTINWTIYYDGFGRVGQPGDIPQTTSPDSCATNSWIFRLGGVLAGGVQTPECSGTRVNTASGLNTDRCPRRAAWYRSAAVSGPQTGHCTKPFRHACVPKPSLLAGSRRGARCMFSVSPRAWACNARSTVTRVTLVNTSA